MNPTHPRRRGVLALATAATVATTAALLALPLAALAQAGHQGHGSHGAQATAAEAVESDFVDAEVRRVDTARQRVTLRHGAMPALDMGPMTMVFAVADPAWLETLKAGDKVQVRVALRGNTYTVTAVRPAP
jgi:Cu(I)/Ag(I) efflux system periplasmic protein CusF